MTTPRDNPEIHLGDTGAEQVLQEADWHQSLPVALLPRDWRRYGDQWLHHFQELGEGTWDSSGSVSFGTSYVRFKPGPGDEQESHLLLILTNHAIVKVYVVGLDAHQKKLEVSRWRATLRSLRERQSRLESYSWQAIIGPDPNAHHPEGIDKLRLQLRDTTAIDKLTLVPASSPLIEASTGHPTSFHGHGIHHSHLIIVTGEAEGWSWGNARPRALIDIADLVGLLTIVTGRCWTLREYPYQYQGQLIQPPQRLMHQSVEEIATDEQPAPLQYYDLPQGMDLLWMNLQRNEGLSQSVLMYNEALQVLNAHPSLALLALVSAIESVGNRVFAKSIPLTKCPECNSIAGSTRRFKATLRLVLAEPEVGHFMKRLDVYDRRSKTAHNSQLHGLEALFGNLEFTRFFSRDPADRFLWEILIPLASVARQLLYRSLVGLEELLLSAQSMEDDKSRDSQS